MSSLAICGKPSIVLDMTGDAVSHQEPWIADDATFGARLALVRQRMGWGNVKTAATECGLPTESWRHWERDGLEPRRLVTIAMAIATKTGCDYRWLVHGPDRGDVRLTGRYDAVKVIAIVGEARSPHQRHVRRESPTRPVRQTRPIERGSSRPRTPVAV